MKRMMAEKTHPSDQYGAIMDYAKGDWVWKN